ncbi:P-type conjugative transfer protein TrbL [Acidithiobacillus caldus]|uniref:P-type conjugative transfer protein TrbL n=1 Tax=Acidithiobacillus caldus TaxID=33059 RepID=UPI001C06A1F8|nr:P-type conjugative transfer protein TrbL [Acidithiobacillus caldus]MBU2801352.1 P-type conjugative transfer protein TrbL [Acidithiobacillus caldus]
MKKYAIWWFLLLVGLAISPDVLAAPAPSINGSGAGIILNEFNSQVLTWYQSLKTDAEEIFYALFGVDFVYLVSQWLIGGKDVHEVFTSFIKKMMSFAFFYTLLLNGHKLIGWVENGFQQSAIQATGASGSMLSWIFGTASQVFMACLVGPQVQNKNTGALESIWQTITGGPTVLLSDLLGMLVGLVVGVIALLAMIYLALEYIAIQLEAAMVASVGIILMGFAGSRWTVQHAEGYLKYALSVGVRFLVILIWIGFLQKSAGTVITQILSQVNGSSPASNLDSALVAYGEVLIFVLLIAWMTKKLPSIASSIMTGASSLSGGSEGTALLAGAAIAGGVGLMGGAALAGRGGAGVMTGAQAASAAGSAGGGAGGAAGALTGAGGAGSGAAGGMGGGAGEAGGLYPGAENAVPAPEPSPQQQDGGLAPTAEQIQAALRKYPTPSARPAGGSAGQGVKVSQGAGGSAVTRGAGGSTDLGAGTGASQVTESGQTAVSSTQESGVEATQGAGGSESLDTGTGASQVTESGRAAPGRGPAGGTPVPRSGAPRSGAAPSEPASGVPDGGTSTTQKTPAAADTSSTTPAQAPASQEALRAALQQSIQQAFAPMQESLNKLNDTLAEGQQKKPKLLLDRLSEYQKGHQVAETLLSPGQAEKTGVQASSLGLKHSE